MNATVYLFGEFNSGYSQYPDDYTASVFKQFYAGAKSTTQVAIHRDGNLMYYGYVRKIMNDRYIGLCVMLNGLYLDCTDGLFSLFENTISSMVSKGQLIHFSDNGEITTSVGILHLNKEEIDLLSESLRAGFDRIGDKAKRLPPVSYATAKDSVKDFSIDDPTDDIVKSSYTNGYTYIYKSKNYNTSQMNNYRGVLSKISKENDRLKKENYDLQAENAKIKKQKKQFRNVILLCVLLIGSGVGLYFLKDTLNTAQGQLDQANKNIRSKQEEIKDKQAVISKQRSVISKQDEEIDKKTKQIANLQYSLSEETNRRMETEKSLEEFKEAISLSIPLLIDDIQVGNIDNNSNIQTNYGEKIYASNSMFLSPQIIYTGIRSGESITLHVKLYDSSGILRAGNKSPEGYSYTQSVTISSGSGNACSLLGWGSKSKGHYGKGKYRFEIWYGNICLGSKTFTLY